MQSLIPPSPRLLVVGLNHKTAPLAVRETVAFDAAGAAAALRRFAALYPHAEAALLSTCNRVELYVARPVAAEPSLDALAAFLADCHALPPHDVRPHLYHHEDRAAVEHLFAVAASLDSMIVGETQILAQVKQAYALATEAGTAGRILHPLFQRGLGAAKHVHEATGLAAGRLSIASVAVDLARSVFDRFDDKTVLCIGAGKMSSLLLAHLSALRPGRVVVTNRSPDRAAALAAEFSAAAAPFEALPGLMTEADIILASTGAAAPLVTAPAFKALLRARRYRPCVIIDIAVPRDVDPAVADLPNTYLYNIDDLQSVAAANRDRRDLHVEAAHSLLAGHVDEFVRWLAARDTGPVVKALYDHAHALARAELDLLLAKTPDLAPAHRDALEHFTHRLIGKLLHTPVTQVTTQADLTARPMLTTALKKLFALNDPPPTAPDPTPPLGGDRA